MEIITLSENKYRILSPAKINLFLYVTGRRDDGYHDLNTLMCQVSLFDTVTVDFSGSEMDVVCSHPAIPDGSGNIAFKAAMLFYKILSEKRADLAGNVSFQNNGIESAGVKIKIEKKIPHCAGLGGGSSNAAAVLLCMNKYYSYPINQNDLILRSAEIGADVPFFVFGHPAIATGIGEKLCEFRFQNSFSVLIVSPEIDISTGEVFRNIKYELTKPEKKIIETNSENIRNRLSNEDCSVLFNDLEKVSFDLYPELSKIKRKLLDVGAAGALMSGSGSSVYGLFFKRRMAEEAMERIDVSDCRLHVADIVT